MFIAHDLSVVRHIADRVAVMYLGRIVEMGPKDSVYQTPHHPYTQALLSAVPEPDPDAAKTRIILEGDVPSPANVPPGCSLPYALPDRAGYLPARAAAAGRNPAAGHAAACHFAAPNPIPLKDGVARSPFAAKLEVHQGIAG